MLPRLRPAGALRLASLRLIAQRLAGDRCSSPAEAVGWMLALQGQDLPGVKWAVGLRASGVTEAGVDAALAAGELVRSWPMRGTLHLVTSADLPWMLALTASRALASAAKRRQTLGITEREIERAREIAVAALPGRATLGRAELLATIEAGGVNTSGQRGYHLLWFLAQTGSLVLGPPDRSGQAFARLDGWLPRPRRLPPEEALAELALRFMRSHGPATAADLARWSGLPLTGVRRGLAAVEAELVSIEVDATRYLLAPETLDATARPAAPHVLLLPAFDEYLLGYRDRSAVLAPDRADAIVPGGNGMFRPTVVVDGEVVGTWSRTRTASVVQVNAAAFRPLSAGELEALERAAADYGRFVGREGRLGAVAEAG